MSRGPTPQGQRSRATIVRAAADIASVEGLDGLSIRRLADQTGMSVSGLHALFGSKEGLQLATVEGARQVYVDEVIAPALSKPAGLAQLTALCENFLSYVDRGVFPGGCFFAAAMAEFDCKPGPVRDRIGELQAAWLSTLQRAAAEATRTGQLRADTDLEQLAFDLEAALLTANWYLHLFSDKDYLERARRSVQARIERDVPDGARGPVR